MTTENDRGEGNVRSPEPVNVPYEREAGTADDTGFDTTMAAGPASGAAGVANAELGTSGTPATELFSAEELARIEADGGTGLVPGAVSDEQLEHYLGPEADSVTGA